MKRLLIAFALLGVIACDGSEIEPREIAKARALLDDGVLRTVILGDSVARGAGDERGVGIAGALDEQFQWNGVHAMPVVNLGINGARTFNVRQLLEKTAARAAVRSADVVVLSIGGNDLYGDSIAQLLTGVVPAIQQHRIVGNVEGVVTKLRELNPAARIYVLGLYNPYRRPSLDRQVNLWDARLIARFASMRDVTVVRICDLLSRDGRISSIDRFHPSARGYQAIAQRIVAVEL